MIIKRTLLRQKCIESALISESSTLNLYPGSYNISPFLTKLLLLQCGIFKNASDKNKSSRKLNEVSKIMHLKLSIPYHQCFLDVEL